MRSCCCFSTAVFGAMVSAIIILVAMNVRAQKRLRRSLKSHPQCHCHMFGVYRNGSKAGPLLYTFNETDPDGVSQTDRGHCVDWCTELVDSKWNNGNLFYLDPIANMTMGQRICSTYENDLFDLYVGAFTSFSHKTNSTGQRSKMKLCCYKRNQVSCPENIAAKPTVFTNTADSKSKSLTNSSVGVKTLKEHSTTGPRSS